MKIPSKSKLALEVEAMGFAFIPSYAPTKTTIEIVSRIGLIEKLAGISEIQELTPKQKADAPPNIYSGNFGMIIFLFTQTSPIGMSRHVSLC